MKKEGHLFAGTSGWVYPHWKGMFYPGNLPEKEKLNFFSRHFNSVELNYSFYRLPKPEIFQTWREKTPPGFIFSVKVSRFITHIKRMNEIDKSWMDFLKKAKELSGKLGPFLFQFPPNFRMNEKNFIRIEYFFSRFLGRKRKIIRFAFEFRDKSWENDRLYVLFKKYSVCKVIADYGNFPKKENITSDFLYIRMHGPKEKFSSEYKKNYLRKIAKKILKWKRQGMDIYIYFNNDTQGFAVKNAKQILEFTKDDNINN